MSAAAIRPEAMPTAPQVEAAPAPPRFARALQVGAGGFLLVCESALLTGLALGGVPEGTAVLLHGVVCALPAFAALALSRSRPTDAGLLLAQAALAGLAGPFGAAIGLAGAALGAQTGGHGALESKPTPDPVRELASAVRAGKVRIEGASQTRPLLDVLAEGCLAERLDALALIARKPQPAFRLTLEAARRDSDPAVRVLAATVLARLQTRCVEFMAQARAQAAERPEDPQAWRALGRACLEAARSGLLASAEAEAEARREASLALRKVAELAGRVAANDGQGAANANEAPKNQEKAA